MVSVGNRLMIKLKSTHISQIANTLLRLATLGAKLGFTLYMGRFLSFADMGTYGLAFGTVMITTMLLGGSLDYVVSREIVDVTPPVALARMRDQAAFYSLNYLALGLVMGALAVSGVTGISGGVMTMIFVLAVIESVANMTYWNMTSLGHPLLANLLLFIRSGAWALVIAFMGILIPSLRNAEIILLSWIVGTSTSLVVTLWAWRHLPWRSLRTIPVDWPWIRKSVKKCFFIWIGMVGLTAGSYVDRFVVAANLNLDLAGVVTFYSSFTVALLTLVQSGILSFTYPRLILSYRRKDSAAFWHEVWKSAWHVAVFAGIIGVIIGVCVPLIGRFFHRQLLVDETTTLWLMLFGMWMQSNAMTLYYILFARHQDRAIWLGNLLYLIPAFGGNAILVPIFGFIGIGYGSVIANAFLLLWRLWYVRIGTQKQGVA